MGIVIVKYPSLRYRPKETHLQLITMISQHHSSFANTFASMTGRNLSIFVLNDEGNIADENST